MTGGAAAGLAGLFVQALLYGLLLSLPALLGGLVGGLLARGLARLLAAGPETFLTPLRLGGAAAGLAVGGVWLSSTLLQFGQQVWQLIASGGGSPP